MAVQRWFPAFGSMRRIFAALVLTLAAGLAGPALADASMTINGTKVNVTGGGSQTINSRDNGIEVIVDGYEVFADKASVVIDGTVYPVQPYSELNIDGSGWGLRVETDGRLVHEITDLEGLEQAAAAGNAAAQNDLGVRFFNGDGVPQDRTRAMELYRMAADQGSRVAQYNLAQNYWNGTGLPKNRELAVQWAMKAAEQGYPSAQRLLGIAYQNGDGVPADITKALEWFNRAADAGHSGAMNSLGFLYARGELVKKDDSEAVRWFQAAADAGLPVAMFNLAIHYRYGRGVPENIERAVELYEAALEGGYEAAADELEELRAERKTTPEEKIYWFAENGEQVGPMTLSELGTAINAARVGDRTLVWKVGLADWVAASTLPEVAELLNR